MELSREGRASAAAFEQPQRRLGAAEASELSPRIGFPTGRNARDGGVDAVHPDVQADDDRPMSSSRRPGSDANIQLRAFQRYDITLQQAQRAKVDLALGKCDLRPGMTLLDVGCGWGSTMLRAMQRHDANVIGLTLSRTSTSTCGPVGRARRRGRRGEVRLQGWEDFDEPVDRIVSIGAFEHFRRERYDAFFDRCRTIVPPEGRMLLHTIVEYDRHRLREHGLKITRDVLLFKKFIQEEIFPGGQSPQPQWAVDGAQAAGFTVERIQPLQQHYAALSTTGRPRCRNATTTRSASRRGHLRHLHAVPDRLRRHVRTGYVDIMQFALAKRAHGDAQE